MPRTTEMEMVQRELEGSFEGSVQILSRTCYTLSFRRPGLAAVWRIDWGSRAEAKRSLGATKIMQWTFDWM